MTAACAQIKFPLPSLNAAFMPSAVLQLIFPFAGIAFLVLVLTDVPELNGVFRCWPARSRCRYPIVGFVPLPLPRAHRGFCPFLKDCDAGTLGWRQPYGSLSFCNCCAAWVLNLAGPWISVSFFFGPVPWDDKLLVAGTVPGGCTSC